MRILIAKANSVALWCTALLCLCTASGLASPRGFVERTGAGLYDTTAHLSYDSLSLPMMKTIGYGARFGAGERRSAAGLRPIFNPFYETPIGHILLSAELLF